MAGFILAGALVAPVLVLGGVVARAQTPDVPDPPALEVSAGEESLGARWTEPADNGAEITSYDLRYIRTDAADKSDANWTVASRAWNASDPPTGASPSPALTAVIPDLTGGVSYDVGVRARNTRGAGAWSATVAGTPVTDHGDDRSTATPLVLGGQVSGSIDPGTDEDWFRLDVTAATEVLVYSLGELDTAGALLSDTAEIVENNDAGFTPERIYQFGLARRLDPGTWYIRVESRWETTGDYILQTEAVADTSPSEAAIVEVDGGPITQIIGSRNDVDRVTFSLATPATVIIGARGVFEKQRPIGLKLFEERFDLGGQNLLVLPDHAFLQDLAAGTYHLQINAPEPSGPTLTNYRLTPGLYRIRVDTAAAAGSARTSAAPLALDRPAGGALESGGDEDWFRLDLSAAGGPTYIAVYLNQASDPPAGLAAAVLDAGGRPVRGLDRWAGGGVEEGFVASGGLRPGVYYLRVTVAEEPGEDPKLPIRYGVMVTENIADPGVAGSCARWLQSTFADPYYGCQWNLRNTGQWGATPGEDINVEPAWEKGFLGAGVVVLVVDTGVKGDHEDLAGNVNVQRSFDYRRTVSDQHGTEVAGLIAAHHNTLGVRGVAPRATIYSYKLLGDAARGNDIHAMTYEMETVAVSSNSWGPDIAGGLLRDSALWQTAVERGVTDGYGGTGVLYVWAAGNSALDGSNANLDEFLTHHTGVPVCAVDHRGVRAEYSETGANLWVCAPSKGTASGPDPGLPTTSGAGYTTRFSGTSAATPQVSGVAALVRSANRSLTWRDVKLILAGSARKNHADHDGWETGALKYGSDPSDPENYQFNHDYGFGVVDAAAAVDLATAWSPLPPLRRETRNGGSFQAGSSGDPAESTAEVGPSVGFTEYVEIDVTFGASANNLEIKLTSPAGATSVVTVPRGSDSFRFGSARHLGENPDGTWKLSVGTGDASTAQGWITDWSLTVYGHGTRPDRPTDVRAIWPTTATDPVTLPVTWEAPASGGRRITSYDLRHCSGAGCSGGDSWTAVESAWTSGPLRYEIPADRSLVYQVQVRARNSAEAAGIGGWSDVVTSRALETADQPTTTSVVPGNGTLRISWVAPSYTDRLPVTGYDLRYGKTGVPLADRTVIESATSGAQRYTVSGLDNGDSYEVQVAAVTEAGRGAWSLPLRGRPRDVNNPPAFPATETGVRAVDENQPAGTDVGAPVAAGDADGDDLVYAVSGRDARFFEIDEYTGQLVTAEPLDREESPSRTVTVTATDVFGDSTHQGVTINVGDENEAPSVQVRFGTTAGRFPENGTGVVARLSVSDPDGAEVPLTLDGPDKDRLSLDDGRLRFSTAPDYEAPGDDNDDNTYFVTVVATDGDHRVRRNLLISVTDVEEPPVVTGQAGLPVEEGNAAAGVFTVADPERGAIRWSLAGADARAFTLAGSGSTGLLSFVEEADFEAPTDTGRDNVYRVRVQAFDGTHTGALDVTVTVGDVDEPGSITLSPDYPLVGVPLRATLHDPDGPLQNVSWQWSDSGGNMIASATSSSYTPVSGDAGKTLRAAVSYSDRHGAGKTLTADAGAAVRAQRSDNHRPAFADPTVTREVPENTRAGTAIGGCIQATDPDGDPLIHSLDSAGAALFEIDRACGRLSTKAPLDHEAHPSHRVRITATDPYRATVTVTVTVTVTDVNEPPVVTGEEIVFHQRGKAGPVGVYRAEDPEGELVAWSLAGGERFTIDAGGVLHFFPPQSDRSAKYELGLTATDAGGKATDFNVDVGLTPGPPPQPPGPPQPQPSGPSSTPSSSGGASGGGGTGGGPSGPAPAADPVGVFGDVASDVYYSAAVSTLAPLGVFAGTECEQGFCPHEPLLRRTMAVWIVRILDGKDPPAIEESRFDDVDASGFHARFIERQAELGVTKGCGDGSGFCPDGTVTRAQMAVFLARAYQLADGPDPGFADVPSGAWYEQDVARLAASGITKGCGDGSGFCPGRDTTRAQMATFLHRARNLADQTDDSPAATADASLRP